MNFQHEILTQIVNVNANSLPMCELKARPKTLHSLVDQNHVWSFYSDLSYTYNRQRRADANGELWASSN